MLGFGRRCIRLNIPAVLLIIMSVVLNGVKNANQAQPSMQLTTNSKPGLHKNSTNANDYPTFINQPQQVDYSMCSPSTNCNELPVACIACSYNSSCVYGKEHQIKCEPRKGVACAGDREFQREMLCRYCWQTEVWEHVCVQKDNCISAHDIYTTNCTVLPDLLCLGKRNFQKRLRCNWTQGIKWSTALVISVTLGGFGADRFYLGHWQEGIGKLFSFGGLGVWTLIDVILISLHYLGPADGSLYL